MLFGRVAKTFLKICLLDVSGIFVREKVEVLEELLFGEEGLVISF